MPAYLPVTAKTVNYAPVVFVGFTVICCAWYFAWGRKNYQGPPKDELAADFAHSAEVPVDVNVRKNE
jgi:hypothetical protein